MLAEIAANPAAWPLWGVLVFAALMYPLGLLLPGCACCASGCTQCGTFATGYADGQDANGRMCCTGTIASSITVRVTNTGPASSVYSRRSAPNALGNYTKVTGTFPCSTFAGDYVMALQRSASSTAATCRWGTGGLSLAGGNVVPLSGTAFPDWYLYAGVSSGTWDISLRTQTCSGYPGVETCNIGTTATTTGQTWATPGPVESYSYPYSISSNIQNAQKCNPSGIVLVDPGTIAWYWGSASSANDATGCQIRVEIV